MNWSRAKTILIFMFLATALFQSYMLYTSEKKANDISPEIIESTVEILSSNGISLNPEIIPKHKRNLPSYNADNAISDNEEFSHFFLGESYTKTNENKYSSKNGTLEISGNSFYFTSKTPYLKKNELFDILGYKEKIQKEETTHTGSDSVTITNYINKLPVFNSQITITVRDDFISTANGKWFNVTNKNSTVRLKSITSVLIDLIKEDIQKPTKITGISLGYTIPESTSFQKSVSLVPVWKIDFEDSNYILADARSPQ